MPRHESEIVDDSSDVASENEYDAREEHDEGAAEGAAQNGVGEGRETKKPKLDPKDPLRPRRKKARRACFACQRAHLTCGMFSHVIDNFACVVESPCSPIVSDSCLLLWVDDFPTIKLTFNRRRETVSTLYQTQSRRCMPRRRQEEGKIPSRCSARGTTTSAWP